MTRYFGFDLGDAESAVAYKTRESAQDPQVVEVDGARSFISAFALTRTGEIIIGERGCCSPRAKQVKLRFKSRFLTDPHSREDVRCFAKGVLHELGESGAVKAGEDCDFYIGCPAGWDAEARESYRAIFEAAGYPPAKIITESRAALMCACRSRHLQMSYDILNKPMLVVDIGSSTTDFAYIISGHEISLRTSGEVALGGGVMDEMLLDEAIKAHPHGERLREIFKESSAWHSYCEFAARRLKEKYFADEEYFSEHGCTRTISVNYRLPMRLTLKIDKNTADKLQNGPCDALGGRSFMGQLTSSLCEVRTLTADNPPLIVFLTGGVSKMAAVRAACRSVFPDAVTVVGVQPEFSVCRGLAWTGAVDEELALFRRDIAALVRSDTVESIVDSHIDSLFRSVVDALVEPVLKNAAIPVFLKWRSGGIDRICDIDPEMTEAISAYLHTDEAKKLLAAPIARWLKPVAAALEEKTIPICLEHGVPYTALSLVSGLDASGIELNVDARSVFAVEEITWTINAIISLLVGMLCGGSGVALIAGGLPGIFAGAAISLLALVLGKDAMQEKVLTADVPPILRRAVPAKFFDSRAGQIKESVQQKLYESLLGSGGDAMRERLISEISGEIDGCLSKMAEVVELPLG